MTKPSITTLTIAVVGHGMETIPQMAMTYIYGYYRLNTDLLLYEGYQVA